MILAIDIAEMRQPAKSKTPKLAVTLENLEPIHWPAIVFERDLMEDVPAGIVYDKKRSLFRILKQDGETLDYQESIASIRSLSELPVFVASQTNLEIHRPAPR